MDYTKYEYMLHTWGGFYNDENIAIHGYKPGYFWFDSKETRDSYLNLLQTLAPSFPFGIVAHVTAEGMDTRLKTIAKMVFVYNDRQILYEHDFGYAFDPAGAKYMFESGNYACDCNRSLFINRIDPDFELLDCGDAIKMENFEIIYVKGTSESFEEST